MKILGTAAPVATVKGPFVAEGALARFRVSWHNETRKQQHWHRDFPHYSAPNSTGGTPIFIEFVGEIKIGERDRVLSCDVCCG
eukprot:gene12365-14505_t